MKKLMRKTVVLTIEQLRSTLDAHRVAGSFYRRGATTIVCECGQNLPNYDSHTRHQAEEIAKLQQ